MALGGGDDQCCKPFPHTLSHSSAFIRDGMISVAEKAVICMLVNSNLSHIFVYHLVLLPLRQTRK